MSFTSAAISLGKAGASRRAGAAAALRKQCVKLANLPGGLGVARPELRPDIRSFAHKGYVIVFRYSRDRLEVVAILEGHRDIDAVFADRSGLRAGS